jgi:hypothetical protein
MLSCNMQVETGLLAQHANIKLGSGRFVKRTSIRGIPLKRESVT